jgi:predicted ribosome quality control (RQC) complex YloA/Tae2 family protein
VSKQNETLAQKLIEERESKDRELSELKRMEEYEQRSTSLQDIVDEINQLKSQITLANYGSGHRQMLEEKEDLNFPLL